MNTSQTSISYETFWVNKIHSVSPGTSEKVLNSKVIAAKVENRDYELPYKMLIDLEVGKLILYAAELYDDWTGIRKKLNDEMLLLFETTHDADMFEAFDNSA